MRVWEGDTVAVLATGPSLCGEDIDYLHGKCRVMTVNDAYKIASFADVLYACDFRWWEHHGGAKEFAGEKWTQDKRAAAKYGLNFIESLPLPGLSFDGDVIHQGRNSGYQAINLAVVWGATRIILLGFDMGSTEAGKTHYFGTHPRHMERGVGHHRKFIREFEGMLPDLSRAGIEVINCSRETALDCFKRLPLREAI